MGLARRDQSRLPVIWFTDSANVRWTRSHTGKLARVVDRDNQRAVSGWQRVLPWRRPVAAPAVVEEQAADGQNAAQPTLTASRRPPTSRSAAATEALRAYAPPSAWFSERRR
jgi:hypothetical protein